MRISRYSNWFEEAEIKLPTSIGSSKKRENSRKTSTSALLAEDIKKRRQEYTDESYKKGYNDPDNHDSVITYLEADIQECEIKWTLGSIPTNKASEDDGIPAELFQILKDDAVKVLRSICQQI